jgi:phage anti-repressor protein
LKNLVSEKRDNALLREGRELAMVKKQKRGVQLLHHHLQVQKLNQEIQNSLSNLLSMRGGIGLLTFNWNEG